MKNKYIIPVSFLCAFLTILSCEPERELVWQDEFDGRELDTTKWTAYVGNGCPELCGFGNHEAQYYTDRPENINLAHGILTITALADSFKTNAYTSAKLVTRNKGDWKYGRVEVKARIPEGRGNWPAIWMLSTENTYGGWPRSGEIDIMEHVGYDQGNMHGTVHTQSFNHRIGTQKGDSVQIEDISQKFHVYAIEWDENKIDFYMDDQLYNTFENTGQGPDDWPFDQPFYLILNLAVGGDWGGKMGIANDVFPNRFEIDYVRVYQ
ncbi:glycoside hydrolase family 16 protein [Roseivirga sp.]|uniref:glycoside hydrolase family 16 protein n=1 Tax=Roseivirga sp. TaxID=1964215 RepID=UPI003B52B2D7